MKNPEKRHSAYQVLRQFQQEMNQWEWAMIKEDFSDLENHPPDEIDAEVDRRRDASRKTLSAIFDKYCECGSKARRLSDVLHWGTERPQYDPSTEKVVSIVDNGDLVVIETQTSQGFGQRMRYELLRKGGHWWIRDNRKFNADFNKNWKRWDL